MRKDVAIKPSILKMNITPYALSKMSEDFFYCSLNYEVNDGRVPLINYYLFCVSIELGIKAILLSEDNSKKRKDFLRFCVGHDLKKLIKEYKKKESRDIFSDDIKKSILQINKYFKNKSMEYFSFPVIIQSLRGFKDFPPLKDIEDAASTVNHLLVENKYFISV